MGTAFMRRLGDSILLLVRSPASPCGPGRGIPKPRSLGRQAKWLRVLPFLAVPGVAWANAGIPVGGDSLIICTQWFVAVVALEHLILRYDLKIPFWRSLGVIFLANLVSTLVGGAIDLATAFLPVAVNPSLGNRSVGADVMTLIYFIPLFFLSWGIEGAIAAWRLRELPRRAVWRCLRRANLASYLLLTVFVLLRACLRSW